ncbi:unnamed protein product [Trichogramma brassicae]|uniref:Protein SCAI n=1 Tax=Trichogramma brassicae TaxID=86971 RepID=A0A6H5J0V1_9HYME|nr:unnamed protein product [Trichogramma brassicae]
MVMMMTSGMQQQPPPLQPGPPLHGGHPAHGSMDEHERKIVVEFIHLLEKSKQLFNGLRDLPQYGHKQWQAYFGRTFDIYTKLWKFQQQHRHGPRSSPSARCNPFIRDSDDEQRQLQQQQQLAVLDTKYGLKRWQIGEIASKIGQLYYHYYLRTSETSYLHEAYSFYAAIRGRAYYSRAAKEDRSDLMVKKLRYYARFIVVCLLLNKMKLVRELVQELDAQIADYSTTYEPDDQVEWNLVLDEIKAFVKAESAVGVLHSETNAPVTLTHRLGALSSPPIERSPPMCLSLQEILIVGNCADQVKFSELSMDMFRMLQTLEREPRDDPQHLHDTSPAGRVPFRPGPYPSENGAPRRDNPHKYLLYKPTFSQVQVFLSSGIRELPANGRCCSTSRRTAASPASSGPKKLRSVDAAAAHRSICSVTPSSLPRFQWLTTWVASRRRRSASPASSTAPPSPRRPSSSRHCSSSRPPSSAWPRAARSPTASIRAISIRTRASRSSSSSTRTTASCSSRYRGCSISRWWCSCRRRTRRRACATSSTPAASSPCSCTRPWRPSAWSAASTLCPTITGSAASDTSTSSSWRPAGSCCELDANRASFSSSATTFCGCCCCATCSATWCCTCTARSGAGSRGRAAIRRCPSPSCSSTRRCTTSCSSWPSASTREITSPTATSLPDPGVCRLRSTSLISTARVCKEVKKERFTITYRHLVMDIQSGIISCAFETYNLYCGCESAFRSIFFLFASTSIGSMIFISCGKRRSGRTSRVQYVASMLYATTERIRKHNCGAATAFEKSIGCTCLSKRGVCRAEKQLSIAKSAPTRAHRCQIDRNRVPLVQTRGRTNGAAPTANPLRRSLSATTTSGATAAAKTPEVRCACQYFGSYSLLPERSALLAANKRPPPHLANAKSAAAAAYANDRRPAAAAGGRTVWQRPAAGNNNRPVQQQLTQSRPNGAAMGDHEYEPVGQPVVRLALSSSTVAVRMVAPVVKITDTAVADSDDSIEDRYRFQQRALILDGDVIVPLDGSIEDNAMAGKNLGDQTIDTLGDDEELSSASSSRPPISGAHRQHNFELAAAIKEARQEAETRKQSLIDEAAAANVESPLRRGARDFQQRLKNQAGRIHSRLSSIQKPTFGRRAKTPTMAKPMKPKPKTMTVPPSPRAEQKASRLERFRMALPERPKFHLPDKSKFHLPDKSKFHLPERPKFNLPDRPKFNMPDTTKLRSHLKKPNIQMPKSFNRVRRSASQRVTKTQESSETAAVSAEEGAQQRRSIFDFSTYPRPKIFERKAKAKTSGEEFATSSPKESRAQSTESWSTFPRVKKAGQSLVARWSQRFGDTAPQPHFPEPEGSVDRSRPWRHPSLEEPRLSLKPQTSQDDEQMPWETASRKNYDLEEASVPLEEDEDRSYGASLKVDPELSYGKAPVRDPGARDIAVQRARSHEERGPADDTKDSSAFHLKSLYDGSFPAVDPRDFGIQDIDDSIEHSEDEESMRSDREIQQSSGSSCERRRRGVIEEIGSDEFPARQGHQPGKHEIPADRRDQLRKHPVRALQLIRRVSYILDSLFFTRRSRRDAIRPRNNATAAVQESPPKRPQRRKRKEESVESFGESSIGADSKAAPQAPKRDHSSLQRSPESFRRRGSIERASSLQATHRVVYQTESTPSKDSDTRMPSEPALDDLVVIKPQRRKSRTSLRSSSLLPEEQNIMFVSMEGSSAAEELAEQKPSPMAPSRRKRFRTSHQSSSLSIRTNDSNLCNGYPDNASPHQSVDKIPPTPPPSPPPNERNRQSRPIDELDYIERSLEEQPTTRRAATAAVASTPIPPKRTRSRTASMIFEDDRTSHGADSLPGDFDAPVLPRDSSSREPSLPGYARIERKDKPPRAPPPRRKRQQGKFATTPRPSKHEAKRSPKTFSHAGGTLRSARSESMR